MSGQTWVNAFNEVGESLLGKSAAELLELKEMVIIYIGSELF